MKPDENYIKSENKIIRRRGVVGRVPAFQPGGPGSIPGGVGNLTPILGLSVCPLSVFCPVFSPAEALVLC